MKQIHSTKIKIRYAETDQMGVVHHSVYPVYFEQARVQMMDDTGVDFVNLEQIDNIVLPVRKITIDYIKPAFFGKDIVVETCIKSVSRVKIIFQYKVLNPENELINTCEIKLGFTDKITGKIVKISDKYFDLFQSML